jgi:surface protein
MGQKRKSSKKITRKNITRKNLSGKRGGSGRVKTPKKSKEPVPPVQLTDRNLKDLVRMYLAGGKDYEGLPINLKGKPLNLWDTSGITEMRNLFEGTDIDENINDWDVSNVTDMTAMFKNAKKFNHSLDNWAKKLTKVTAMNYMFENAKEFNQDINSWGPYLSNVTDMSGLFKGAENYNKPMNSWDVSKVKYMSVMFKDAKSFNQNLNNWDVSNVVRMSEIFWGCPMLNHIENIEEWDLNPKLNIDNAYPSLYGKNDVDYLLKKVKRNANIARRRNILKMMAAYEKELEKNNSLATESDFANKKDKVLNPGLHIIRETLEHI